MTRSAEIFTWFRESDLPPLSQDPAVVIGGRSLLTEFLTIVGETSSAHSRLTIAVPFISSGVTPTIGPTLSTLNHSTIDLRLVVGTLSSVREAERSILHHPWRSALLARCPSLHAKLYTYRVPDAGGAALIGSQNLSLSALRRNHEAGVLFVARRPGPLSEILTSTEDRVLGLLPTSQIVTDTTTLLFTN